MFISCSVNALRALAGHIFPCYLPARQGWRAKFRMAEVGVYRGWLGRGQGRFTFWVCICTQLIACIMLLLPAGTCRQSCAWISLRQRHCRFITCILLYIHWCVFPGNSASILMLPALMLKSCQCLTVHFLDVTYRVSCCCIALLALPCLSGCLFV